jgi:hypothetical protein
VNQVRCSIPCPFGRFQFLHSLPKLLLLRGLQASLLSILILQLCGLPQKGSRSNQPFGPVTFRELPLQISQRVNLTGFRDALNDHPVKNAARFIDVQLTSIKWLECPETANLAG